MKRKVMSMVAVLVVSFAMVALAARYEELVIGLLKCTSISDQNGASPSTPAQIVTARTAAGTAIQPTTAAYTNAVALAGTALQPNAVAVTNVIVGVGDITNTIVVIGGQITSWTVAP